MQAMFRFPYSCVYVPMQYLLELFDAMQMLFCENLNSTKLRMKHLGGKWFCMVYVEWVPRGFPCGITLVDGHPGT